MRVNLEADGRHVVIELSDTLTSYKDVAAAALELWKQAGEHMAGKTSLGPGFGYQATRGDDRSASSTIRRRVRRPE